jgi:hypothetical protein
MRILSRRYSASNRDMDIEHLMSNFIHFFFTSYFTPSSPLFGFFTIVVGNTMVLEARVFREEGNISAAIESLRLSNPMDEDMWLLFEALVECWEEMENLIKTMCKTGPYFE